MMKEVFRGALDAFKLVSLIAFSSLVSGCGTLRGNIALDDNSVVQTPAYAANKVLFLDRSEKALDNNDPGRYSDLVESYQLSHRIAVGDKVGLRRSVLNRQPLSIVVSRAYIPTSLQDCSPRISDIAFGSGRDIAVLLDTATSAEEQEFIAVWYQRDVRPGDTLNFQDLLVYGRDAWDSKFPPYFRLRLIDVSFERNTALGGLLDKVRGSSKSIAGALGAGEAAPIIGIAALAARQVLANDKNIPLVDFTFQLYGASLLAESGGMPVGVLQSGGMIVTAPPCGVNNAYWEGSLVFDHRLNRVEDQDFVIQEVPYVTATILTADLSVPQIVRTRSNAIMKRLSDPQVIQSELVAARDDAAKLVTALNMLNVREAFRRRPSKESFAALVTDVGSANIDDTEKGFFLDSFYQVTGRNLADISAYNAWIKNCSATIQFDQEAGRFVVDKAIKGKDGQACWPE